MSRGIKATMATPEQLVRLVLMVPPGRMVLLVLPGRLVLRGRLSPDLRGLQVRLVRVVRLILLSR